MDSRFYSIEHNGKRDWRVYAVSLSGGRGTCLGLFETKRAAYTWMMNRYAVR